MKQSTIRKEVHTEYVSTMTDVEKMEKETLQAEWDALIKEINEEIPKLAQEYWEEECVNNKENNPKKLPPPTW